MTSAMTIEDRVELHRRMAAGYRDAYLRHDVLAGQSYEAWRFAHDAVYSSPYFTGDVVLLLKDVAESAAVVATMEAKAYSVRFPDWEPVRFTCWPADNGFAMRTQWEGTSLDGGRMGFYSIGSR